jgi:hypothetical protein
MGPRGTKTLHRKPKYVLKQIGKLAGADVAPSDTKEKLVDKLLATPGMKLLLGAGLTTTAAFGIYYTFLRQGQNPKLADVQKEILAQKGSTESSKKAAEVIAKQLSACKDKASNFTWKKLGQALATFSFSPGLFFKLPIEGKLENCCLIEWIGDDVSFEAWDDDKSVIYNIPIIKILEMWLSREERADKEEQDFLAIVKHFWQGLKLKKIEKEQQIMMDYYKKQLEKQQK